MEAILSNTAIAIGIMIGLCFLGYDAELLVPEIEDISLSERVKRVNKICDEVGKEKVILISVHSNAMGNGSKWEKATGWEAYTSFGKTESDNIVPYFYDKAEKYFQDKKIRYDWGDEDCDKEESFYIIKKTKCPAILTENEFMTTKSGVEFLESEEGRKKICDLHVETIKRYIKMEYGEKRIVFFSRPKIGKVIGRVAFCGKKFVKNQLGGYKHYGKKVLLSLQRR